MTDLKMFGSVDKEERLQIVERELCKLLEPEMYEAMIHHIRTACMQYYYQGRRERHGKGEKTKERAI
jgi:hypothetical protein